MNGIKGKLWIKLTAICVAMLSAAILAISSVAVAIMLENDVFFDGGQRLSEDVWQTSISNKLNDVVLGIESCEPLEISKLWKMPRRSFYIISIVKK